jgi:hypothetical protein
LFFFAFAFCFHCFILKHKLCFERLAKFGDYWRLLVKGDYTIQVSAKGHKNAMKFVRVSNNVKTVNFQLQRSTGVLLWFVRLPLLLFDPLHLSPQLHDFYFEIAK